MTAHVESSKSGGVEFYRAIATIDFPNMIRGYNCEFVAIKLEASNFVGATDREGEYNAVKALAKIRFSLHPAIREAFVRAFSLDYTCDEWPGPDSFESHPFSYNDERPDCEPCPECEEDLPLTAKKCAACGVEIEGGPEEEPIKPGTTLDEFLASGRPRYAVGDRVEVFRSREQAWLPGRVDGERFNGGNGGYWNVIMDGDAGEFVTVDAARIRMEKKTDAPA